MRAEFISANYLAPRHWPYWLLLGLQRALVLLPWFVQRGIGHVIGLVASRTAAQRRAVVDGNLAIAYPRLSNAQRDALREQHFHELGIGLMQLGLAWWASDRKIASLCDVSGLEHLPTADHPQATFLVSGHFTTLDMVSRGLAPYASIDVMHRPLGIDFIDAVTHHARQRYGAVMIDKHAPKALIESLRRARTVWIATDQADTTGSSVSAPFFGQPALTNTTVSRLAARYDANVLPVNCIRTPAGRFRIVIEPPIVPFGGDVLRDATTLNRMVERHINHAPAQYFWVHRRFKQRERDES